MEEKTIKVEQTNCMPIGFAGTTVCFIFSTLCFLFWGNLTGRFPKDATLAMGCVQLGVVIAYHLCSAKVINTGDSFNGNIFMVFSAFFGGVGGLNNVVAGLAQTYGWNYDGYLMGYVWMLCGIFLLMILPACLKDPVLVFILYAVFGVALIILGLVIIGRLPGSLSSVVGWMLFAGGVMGLYMTANGMLGFAGINVPMGPPIKK